MTGIPILFGFLRHRLLFVRGVISRYVNYTVTFLAIWLHSRPLNLILSNLLAFVSCIPFLNKCRGYPPVDGQGTRTDLQKAVDLTKEFGIKRVARELPSEFVKFHRGLKV